MEDKKNKFTKIVEENKDSREFEKLMLYEAKVAGDLYVQKVSENLDKIMNKDGSFSMDKYIVGMEQLPDLLKNKPFQTVKIVENSKESLIKRVFSWIKRKTLIKRLG